MRKFIAEDPTCVLILLQTLFYLWFIVVFLPFHPALTVRSELPSSLPTSSTATTTTTNSHDQDEPSLPLNQIDCLLDEYDNESIITF